MSKASEYTDRIRADYGFFTPDELVERFGETNIFYDLGSVLISRDVRIGEDNTFYPNVVIETDTSTVGIGDQNAFYPGTFMLAEKGPITIGSRNIFGDGGCRIKTNAPQAEIIIGDDGRYTDGATILGRTSLGNGSQVLGNIQVINCVLEGGESWIDADPDLRAAVLKGYGKALGIELGVGHVMNGAGDFAQAAVELQRSYHPKP
jgi:acetyltransferase-like isoleucine patch superfamily enzyme